MPISVTHTTAAVGVDSGDSLISKNEWNEAHTITGNSIQTFTPVWDVLVGGTSPTLGNGTIFGHYQLIADKLYWISIHLTLGSTSTVGSGQYRFTGLPFTVKSTSPAYQAIAGSLRDAGTASYALTGRLSAGTTEVGIIVIGTGSTGSPNHLTNANPLVPGSGDDIFLTGIVASN